MIATQKELEGYLSFVGHVFGLQLRTNLATEHESPYTTVTKLKVRNHEHPLCILTCTLVLISIGLRIPQLGLIFITELTKSNQDLDEFQSSYGHATPLPRERRG